MNCMHNSEKKKCLRHHLTENEESFHIDLPEFAMPGSRPRAAGTAIAALKFLTLSSVLEMAI